jgi:ribonuclease BN (tRNA processing enzyme)
VELTVVGCSGSMSGPHSAASCYLVEHDGFRLLLDLGNGAVGALMNLIDLRTIDAVAFSHLHADHCIDLTSLYVARRYGGYGTGRRLPVYGPSDTPGRMSRAYDVPERIGLGQDFDFHDVGLSREIGPFRLSSAPMLHPVEAYALRLEAGGSSLVYTGDTAANDRLVELARDASVLLSEASFLDGVDNPPALHMTGTEAGEVARAAGVGRLVVTHVPPWYQPVHAHAAASETFDGPVDLATVGLRLPV